MGTVSIGQCTCNLSTCFVRMAWYSPLSCEEMLNIILINKIHSILEIWWSCMIIMIVFSFYFLYQKSEKTFWQTQTVSVMWSIVKKQSIHRAFTFNMVDYCTAFDCSNNGTTEGIWFQSFPKDEKQIKVSFFVFILGVLKGNI